MDFEEQPRLSQLPEKVKEALVDERVKVKYWNGLLGRVLEDERKEELGWCDCGVCDTSTIGAVRSCFCCREVEPYLSLSQGQCVTKQPRFAKSCLDVDTLILTAKTYDLAKGRPVADDAAVRADHASLRFAAYRNFIFSSFGKLGRGHRREIPACVLSVIRATFPDPHGNYVDFKG